MTTNQSTTSFIKSLSTSLVVTAGLLLIPFVAMQVTDEVQWSPFDFLVAAVLLFAGVMVCLQGSGRLKGSNRFLGAIFFALIFIYIWAELSVGIFTNLGS